MVMYMLDNIHKFTIILPSCLRHLQVASVFPLSSLLQKGYSQDMEKDIGTDLRFRQGASRAP